MGTGSLKCCGFLSTDDVEQLSRCLCCWGSIDGDCGLGSIKRSTSFKVVSLLVH